MMNRDPRCPVCGRPRLVSTLHRSRLPAMQNYVFRSYESAMEAESGPFDLAVCGVCGFARNVAFDSRLLHYDRGYDNSVPSRVMSAYYEEIAVHLHDGYRLENGLIVDVGCGKGAFLKIACEMSPTARGLGIDPSYQGETSLAGGRIRFIRDYFSAEQIGERPAIVVCRHVLEHVPDPVAFSTAIHAALQAFPETPVFFEVPDTNWIVEHGAFWDFCYEHCNYFTGSSLGNALMPAGFARPHSSRTAFGDQYVWVETFNASRRTTGLVADGLPRMSQKLAEYARTEAATISRVGERLHGLKSGGSSIAIWGMATKGTIFACLLDPTRTLFDFCVDINTNKQGGFVPLTGHRIDAPEVLSATNSRPLVVVVMNSNYASEIKERCRALALEPVVIDANSNEL